MTSQNSSQPNTSENTEAKGATQGSASPENSTGVDLSTVTVALIGAGNMGGAVAQAMRAAGVSADKLLVVNSSQESSERAAQEVDGIAASREEAVAAADVLILGVKPYQVIDMLDEIAGSLREDALVISLAAAVTLDAIEEALDGGQAAIRAMPNTPISVGEGAVGLMHGSRVDDATHDLAHALFSQAGVVVDISEDQVHAFIGAAGSLSGFVFSIIEAMTDEAVRLGLKRNLADQLVQQTVRGAATMLMQTGTHPAVAKNGVSSPGGTTVEGLAELERQGVRPGIARAMQAAAERSREMTEG